MSLIRNIRNAVRKEVKDYLLTLVEGENEQEKTSVQAAPKAEPKEEKPAVQEVPAVQEAPKPAEAPKAEEKAEEPVKEAPKAEEKAEEPVKEKPKKVIIPVINPDFVKFSYKSKSELITIPKELADVIRMLPLEEYACFIKLFCFVQDQKKNYGYWGSSLKKKIGLDYLSTAEFDELGDNLEDYGLLSMDQINDNQRIFVLYIPFDEELMVKNDAPKPASAPKKKAPEKPAKKEVRKEEPEEIQKEEDIPGKPVEGMENDEMYKSYKTFVSLEIDKAKMRVGRSNFDKIYMEAVKYIDKKYGFKVLSDSDKFKEYLTNYYISAFDIPTFEAWKKNRG